MDIHVPVIAVTYCRRMYVNTIVVLTIAVHKSSILSTTPSDSWTFRCTIHETCTSHVTIASLSMSVWMAERPFNQPILVFCILFRVQKIAFVYEHVSCWAQYPGLVHFDRYLCRCYWLTTALFIAHLTMDNPPHIADDRTHIDGNDRWLIICFG